MNWLIIQRRPGNPENEQFGRPWERALIRAGHGVCMYGPGYPEVEARERDRVDILLYTVDYREEWVPGLSGYRMPKIAIFMDAHLNLKAMQEACRRHKFDHIVTNVKGTERNFRPLARRKAIWLPNAFDPTLMKKTCHTKHTWIGFCGNVANRAEWIRKMKNDIGLTVDIGVIGNQMVDAISGYRIHWNRNISHDVNCRTFETTGIGTCLLTNETPGLRDCFTPDKHVIIYKDYDDCIAKVKMLKADHGWTDAVAQCGYQHAHEQHTYDRRVQQVLEMIG